MNKILNDWKTVMVEQIKDSERLYAGIEAGGTKFVCAVANQEGRIIAKTSFATEAPAHTMERVVDFFKPFIDVKKIVSVGVGAFGPIVTDPDNKRFGEILNSPKVSWQGFNIYAAFRNIFNTPVYLETDVNVALLAEMKFGAGRGYKSVSYITVGTGIGGGHWNAGQIFSGYSHPEIGHAPTTPLAGDELFSGVCTFHKNKCFEGLASGPALRARWGDEVISFPQEHEAWQQQAKYLAQLCSAIVLQVCPQKIILGGGVMEQVHLFSKINQSLAECLANYLDLGAFNLSDNEFVIPQGLQGEAGILGAIEIAAQRVRL